VTAVTLTAIDVRTREAYTMTLTRSGERTITATDSAGGTWTFYRGSWVCREAMLLRLADESIPLVPGPS
jgi:hypothetical protein